MDGTASRKSAQAVLHGLARQPLAALAEAAGVDESVASRMRSGEARATVAQFCALLDAAGLRVVAAEHVCIQKDRLDAITTLLAAAMSDAETVRKLVEVDS